MSKGIALEHIEPIGTFRCPNCAEVEKKNKSLEKQLFGLQMAFAVVLIIMVLLFIQ